MLVPDLTSPRGIWLIRSRWYLGTHPDAPAVSRLGTLLVVISFGGLIKEEVEALSASIHHLLPTSQSQVVSPVSTRIDGFVDP